jgi:hypothetical protein
MSLAETPAETPAKKKTRKKQRKPKKRLQPRRKTLEQLGVCARTPERWEKNPAIDFPTPTYINGRKYDDPDQIAAFIAKKAGPHPS